MVEIPAPIFPRRQSGRRILRRHRLSIHFPPLRPPEVVPVSATCRLPDNPVLLPVPAHTFCRGPFGPGHGLAARIFETSGPPFHNPVGPLPGACPDCSAHRCVPVPPPVDTSWLPRQGLS